MYIMNIPDIVIVFSDRYGSGYSVTMTMPEKAQAACSNFITTTFSDAVLKETHTGNEE